jgi:hypothetical protein
MSRAELELAKLLIAALHTIAREHHDVVDVGGGDRPGQGPNWAMQITNQLEEIEALFRDGAHS